MALQLTNEEKELLDKEPENFVEFARARDKRSRLRDDYSDRIAEIKSAELHIKWMMKKMGAWIPNG